MTSKAPILIIGGGIAGLALAHAFQKHHIPFSLFERELSHAYHAQGYRIRIGAPGLSALEYLFDASTWDNLQLAWAENPNSSRPIPVIDALSGGSDGGVTTKPLKRGGGAEERSAPVDRASLRDVMLQSLGSSAVQFGKRLQRKKVEI